MTPVPHLAYSPDMAPPSDFYMFPKIKLRLNGRRFVSIEEIQTISSAKTKSMAMCGNYIQRVKIVINNNIIEQVTDLNTWGTV